MRSVVDHDARALGREIARLRRHVRELEVASQGAFRSVEDGAIDVYDDEGVLRERIGKQKDGSFGRKSFTGDPPPAPTEPDVVVIRDGVVAVTWDGRFEERYTGEFRNVQIHLGDMVDFVPTRNTQEGAIFARRGGTVVCVTESDDDNPVWVRLVATNRAGEAGPPSDAVLVDELDEDDLEDEQEELAWEDADGHTLTAANITAGTVTFALSHIPEQQSVLGWWHPGGPAFAGVPQSQYTVDYEAQTVTWPLSGFEEPGDRLRVYYPYYAGTPGVPELTLIGSTGVYGELSEVALPAGTQPGDLIVLCGRSITSNDGREYGSVSCPDPRMAVRYRDADGRVGVWAGFADDSGAAVQVSAVATGSPPAGGFLLVVFRGARLSAQQQVAFPPPESTPVPTVNGKGAVAVKWVTYSTTQGVIAAPAGYTKVAEFGASSRFLVSTWRDETGDATTSPAGESNYITGVTVLRGILIMEAIQ